MNYLVLHVVWKCNSKGWDVTASVVKKTPLQNSIALLSITNVDWEITQNNLPAFSIFCSDVTFMSSECSVETVGKVKISSS